MLSVSKCVYIHSKGALTTVQVAGQKEAKAEQEDVWMYLEIAWVFTSLYLHSQLCTPLEVSFVDALLCLAGAGCHGTSIHHLPFAPCWSVCNHQLAETWLWV